MSNPRRRLAILSGVGAAAAVLFTGVRRRPAPAYAPAHDADWAQAEDREAQLAAVQRGEPGSGGYYGTWKTGSPDAAVAAHIEFQYAGMEHQSETALSGMWLFLATEVLFFGGLFLLYMIYRQQYADAFIEASRHTELVIGSINTVLLVTSSAVFSWGLGRAQAGDNRRLFWACVAVVVLGSAFLLLKGWEWHDDLDEHLFPGRGFSITGPNAGGAELFWFFYFVATGLHGVHMIVGVGLVAWLAWAARQRRFSAGYFTPVEVVGLYWSFVDMVWLCLYPMLYLVDRASA
ncbi:cytochrome c oxidase subunit 3 [Rhodopila sp.]|uniref:cytochrome c oxidase subunit 3 n=1 Tax=Rhodopila sp. TaxID=2480087 RepID=UPI003D141A7B